MTDSPTRLSPELDRLCIDAIRVLAMDAVQKANSGHPGTPMALAPLGYLLWTRHLRHNPADPAWADRDRFVLSVGHASMLIYSLLHLTGYDLSKDEIVKFRQWGSLTPGHPEFKHTPGIETTTGPLGQGVANSVGMALAERWLADRFNRPGHQVVDHYTYAMCSDGDLMEGISHEVAAMAGHQKLGKLIWMFDDNRITIEGGTDLSTATDQGDRFLGYQWHVQHVDDGTDLAAVRFNALATLRLCKDLSHLVYAASVRNDWRRWHEIPRGLALLSQTTRRLQPNFPEIQILHSILPALADAFESSKNPKHQR